MSEERVCPPPEHTSRQPWPAGVPVPSAPAKLLKGLEAVGWRARVTYAQGWALPVELSAAPYPVASVAVRFARVEGNKLRAGYVVYFRRLDRDPKWEAKSFLVYGSDHWPFVMGLNITEITRYVVEGWEWEGREVDVWKKGLARKVIEAKERAAAKAKARGPKGKAEVS